MRNEMYAMKSEKKKKILHKRYTHIYSVGKHQSKKNKCKEIKQISNRKTRHYTSASFCV